jgi:hypothetical protein
MSHTPTPWKVKHIQDCAVAIIVDADNQEIASMLDEAAELTVNAVNSHAALVEALKELIEISGEANIPLVNAHAVRKMAKFIKARDNAKAALALVEGKDVAA